MSNYHTNPRPAIVTRQCIREGCEFILKVNELQARGDRPEGVHTLTCRCGIEYSATIIYASDEEVWDQILKRDGFTVTIDDNGDAVVTDERPPGDSHSPDPKPLILDHRLP